MQEATKTLHAGDTFEVTLQSRGGLGLQIRFSATPEDIVAVDRLVLTPAQQQPGDAIPAVWRVTALKAGSCKLLFYETRPWDQTFEPIVQLRYDITVNER